MKKYYVYDLVALDKMEDTYCTGQRQRIMYFIQKMNLIGHVFRMCVLCIFAYILSKFCMHSCYVPFAGISLACHTHFVQVYVSTIGCISHVFSLRFIQIHFAFYTCLASHFTRLFAFLAICETRRKSIVSYVHTNHLNLYVHM